MQRTFTVPTEFLEQIVKKQDAKTEIVLAEGVVLDGSCLQELPGWFPKQVYARRELVDILILGFTSLQHPSNQAVSRGSPGVGKSVTCVLTALAVASSGQNVIFARKYKLGTGARFALMEFTKAEAEVRISVVPLDRGLDACKGAVAMCARLDPVARVILDGFHQEDLKDSIFFNYNSTSTGWTEHEQDRESLSRTGGRIFLLTYPAWVLEPMWAAVCDNESIDWPSAFQIPKASTKAERKIAVEKKYWLTGGSMRELLMKWEDAQIIQKGQMEKVVSAAQTVGGKFGQANMPHHILRSFVNGENYEYPEYHVDSRYQLRRLMDLIDLKFYHMQLEFGRSRGGSLYGILFEEYCHKYISDKKGVELSIRLLSDLDAEAKWEDLKLEFESVATFGATKSDVLQDVRENLVLKQYWKPAYDQFPVDDAGCVVEFGDDENPRQPLHLQYTIAKRKSAISLRTLSEIDYAYELNAGLGVSKKSMYLIVEDTKEKAEAIKANFVDSWGLADRTCEYYIGYPKFS